eukprot:6209665-Pleurochrysis_carterae.AAC.1
MSSDDKHAFVCSLEEAGSAPRTNQTTVHGSASAAFSISQTRRRLLILTCMPNILASLPRTRAKASSTLPFTKTVSRRTRHLHDIVRQNDRRRQNRSSRGLSCARGDATGRVAMQLVAS